MWGVCQRVQGGGIKKPSREGNKHVYRHYIRVPERGQEVNTAEKMRAVEECSCGKFCSSPEGAAACQANKHGSGKDAFGDRFRFVNTMEMEYSVWCAECGEKLRFKMTREEI